MRFLLSAVIVFVVALFRVQAAPIPLAEFPFQFREGLLWVEVNIPESQKPLNFLLDTGSGVSAINLGTVKRIGLKFGRKVTVRGVETTLTGYWQQQMSAKVDNVRLPSNYLAVDLEKLSRSCERPVDGLVGADFFREHVVQIDFDAQKIRILKPEKAGKSDDTIPLQLRPCGMRVPVSVNGQKRQWVRLDTGCATAFQWVTSDVPDQCTRQMAIGLAEISIAQTKTTVGIGDHIFNNVPTGLHEKAIFPGESGLLGNGLLSRFSAVTIDAKAGHLVLRERPLAQ
ncbi:MAG TPA: aspartyl protease family protein [Verrucomicrobiae bacterium]|nr:aspartyl protease family protein [Verrucomicrobiae bacterium]